jgi:hypothetical protein
MLRKSHGTGARSAIVRVETCPPDELPRGVPAPASPEPFQDPRKDFGPLPKGSPEARAQAALASRAAAEKRARIRALQGLGFPNGTPEWLQPYEAQASEFCEVITRALADTVGGGECPTFAAILVQNAALALAASRAAYELVDPALGAKLADSARTQVLTAWELTGRAATSAQKRGAKVPPALAKYLDLYEAQAANAQASKGAR